MDSLKEGHEMEKFTVTRTSSTSADVTNDILLSETGTTRRIFRARFVRKPSEQEWRAEGSLICQRKNSKDVWEDSKDIKLSELRAGEGVAVNLDSTQTANLIDGLDSLKAIAGAKGVKAYSRGRALHCAAAIRSCLRRL